MTKSHKFHPGMAVRSDTPLIDPGVRKSFGSDTDSEEGLRTVWTTVYRGIAPALLSF